MTNSRITENLNDDWKFLKLTQKDGLSELSIEKPEYDDSKWTDLSLPHTWNESDCCAVGVNADEGGERYYRGLGGYRKNLFFSKKEFADKEVFLEFKGANTVAEVFVNGVSAGTHKGGYSLFRFDITDHIQLDENNLIAVKVNNAPTDYIAPITDQGDFTKMGGLYRDVNLIAVQKIHIDLTDYGSSGIYVTPKNISGENADIDLLIKIANDRETDEKITVKAKITGMNGETAAEGECVCSVSQKGKSDTKLSVKINDPVLWNGRENPCLYNAKITLQNGENVLDEYTQSFGIRTYHIDTQKGFFLNGKYIDLHGVNYHQDSFESGWAMTNEQRVRDYDMMLEMGCNTVRMAHYQHDACEYDLCDRHGITVWSEIGIVNKMSADNTADTNLSPDFKENAKQQLTELIRQNYNHPSVIVWGISNELHQMSDEIFDFYGELNALAKTEDSTRLITYADNQFWGRFLELPADVVGCNRYFGWYKEAGSAEMFGAWLDNYHKEKQTRPVCVSEYGGGGALSQHKDNIDWETEIDSWGERHYENYQSALHEAIWAQFSQRQYLWAKYVWCMFDFSSNGRQEGDTEGQNDKGLVTRERVPKDSFYFYKSVWNSVQMLHITEKGFKNRPSLVPKIKVYSNAERVELFINGSSVGVVERKSLDPNYSTVYVWENIAIIQNKENEIKAKAYFSDGKVLEDTSLWFGL